MRVYIGPVEIAGYYSRLAEGMRLCEVDVRAEFLTNHPFQYGGGGRSWLARLIKFFTAKRERISPEPLTSKLVWGTMLKISLVAYVIWTVLRHDVFIFAFGSSLLRGNRDLPILRILGKKIIFNMGHGSEMRPSYIDGSLLSIDGSDQPSVSALNERNTLMTSKIQYIEKNVDIIIGSPFSSTQFARKRMVNSFVLGIPLYPEKALSAEARFDHRELINILHAPSHPRAKGTEIIRAAISSLREKGYELNYVEITDQPNHVVLDALNKCHFVVDQVYSDVPMPGFSAEAAWFGKPAVIGGYRLKELERFIPKGMCPPSQICQPQEIESAIEQLIVDENYRRNLGAAAQDFVRSKWSAEKVAKRYISLIEGEIPHAWWINPRDVKYLHGCGLSEVQTQENIRKVVEYGGREALGLSHRLDLEEAFMEFSGIRYSKSSSPK